MALRYEDLPSKAQEELRRQNPQLDPAGHAFGESHAPRPKTPPHTGRRRPAAPPRPSPTRPRARQAVNYVRQTAAAADTVTPRPVKGGLSLLYGALAAGVGFAMLYLFLTSPGTTTSLLNLGGGGFRRLVSAQVPLFGAAPDAGAAAANAYLQTPAGAAAAAGGLGAVSSALGGLGSFIGTPPTSHGTVGTVATAPAAVQKAAILKLPVMSFPGYTFNPATDQYVKSLGAPP